MIEDLTFSVGALSYRVVWMDERPESARGVPCEGVCRFEAQEILIWRGMAPERRVFVLGHELWHAWMHHFPQPQTEEDACDLVGMYSVALKKGLDRLQDADGQRVVPKAKVKAAINQVVLQAKELKNLSYEPLEVEGVPDLPKLGNSRRCCCAGCQKVFCDASVVDTKPRWDDMAGGYLMDRTLHCDFCNHLQKWTETCSGGGKPLGVVMGQLSFESSRGAVRKFLQSHSELAGVDS